MQITKTLKRSAPPPKTLEQIILQLQTVDEQQLIQVIQNLGNWVWPKTDLFHWISVLNRVDSILERIVTKYELPHQKMPLEENDKDLLLSVLNLTKTLWDNATNRNLYNSYEHLHNLLCLVEYEVVYELLRFLVKPAQRIPSQRSLRTNFTNGQSKYQVLAGRWNVGLDVNEILSSNSIQVEMINYQYYRTATDLEIPKDEDKIEIEQDPFDDSKSHLKQDSLVTVPLQPTEPKTEIIFEQIQKVKADYHIEDDRAFELLWKIRLCSFLSNPEKRIKLYCIRMLSLAILSNLYSEEVATNKIFLFESDLISQVAQNLANNTNLGQDARFCCLTLLDNLAHYRGKLNEVLSVMNASANHGLLMVELNNAIESNTLGISKANVEGSTEFVEGLFSFLTFILGTQVGGNMIISAGIIPLLISSFNNSLETHLKIIAKCCNMLDNILYGFPPALNVFTGANGLQALVTRIQLEIDTCLRIKEKFSDSELNYSSIDPGASVKYRELLARMPLLRAIMKLVLHMMQSSGTADGMRNLIDSSLPKSLLIIFENSKLFGSIGVFGLAVNIMSTFIHNEPTSLSILQENQVISAFLNAANQELPVSAEVISAFPNAFGAICLNAPGLQAFTSANPMSNFLSVLTKEDHLKTLLDNDVPHLVGNSIDEFIRHHPTTKDMVMSAIIEMLEKVINIGETISVDINEGTELSQLCPNGKDIKHEKGESRMSQLIDVSCRFLEGLFQNVSHCKDFLKFNGLQLLIRFFTLKAIPHDFGTSPSSAPLSYIVRVILEVNLQETSNLVAEEVHKLFGNISVFLNYTGDSSYVFPYVDALEPEKISEGSQLFHNLVGLKCYIRLLTDLFCSHALSHSKAINSIIATFTSSMGSKLIEMFGKLGRSCSLESFYFREKIPEHWIADPDNMLDVFNKLSYEEKLSSRNAEYFLHLLLEIPKDILGVFKGILKIICTRKVSDTENRKHIQDIVDEISKLLLKNLENPNLESEGKEIMYYNTILAETKGLLCDEKTTPFLNTAQLVSFEKMGGIESLFSILRKYLSFSGDPTKLPKPVEAILSILNTATNHKMLHDSSHTSIMAGRTKEKKSSEYFNPHSFLVHIRGKVLTEILDIWEKEDFVKLPNSCIQLVIQIVTQIMAAEGEVPSEAATIFSTSARIPFLGETLLVRHINPAAIVPDESKIALLVDMGFPRGAAEVALRRCGNNVARAADYLINHPEVVAIAQTTPNTNPATNPPPNPENSTATPDNVPPSIQPVQQNQQSAINIQPAISIDPDLTNHAISDSPQNAISEIPAEELMLDDTIDRDNEESESDSNAEKEALSKLRDEAKAKIQLRCIEILIHIDSIHIYIIKDLLCLIAKDNMKNIADSIGKKISEVKAKLVQKQDDSDLNANLSTYFRLVTLLSSENSFQKDIIYSVDLKVSEYFTLIENCQHQRDWYTPFLLFLESMISLVDEPADSSESNSGNSVREFTRAEREMLLIQLIRIINFESTDSDLLHSVLRLLVRLTRNTELSQLFVLSNGISALLKNEKFASFPAHQSLVVMILRHCLESEDVLRAIIEADVSSFLKSPRPRSMELQTFIKATSHLVCRNPELFVEVCSNICELYHYDPNARSHQINIKPTFEAEPKNEVVSKGDSTPKASIMEHIFSEEKLSSVTGKIVSYLTSELLTLKSKSKFNIADVDNMKLHLRRCYLLQCLSELVVCYFDSKIDLIRATQKKNIKQIPKSPTKNPFLNYLLNDLMHPENIYLDSSKIEKFRHTHQVTESTWASCLITGLCFHKGKLDENRSAELKSIRTIVLDSIFKSLKDTFNNIDLLPEVRFGKLINLCELCYKILTVKGNNVTLSSNQSASNLSEPTLQIVQLMIEKGFVNLFTNILADLDIHHPISQKVVETVLKPLEVFSKAAITLGKSEVNIGIKGKKVPNTPISSNAFDTAFREIVDESMGEENELSSVYRNSALGMLDPASEEEESDSEEEDSDLFETFSGDEEMEEDSEEDGESSTEDEMEIVVPQPFQGNQDVTSSEDEQGNLESEEEMHIDDGAHWQTEVLTEEEIDEGDSEPEDDEDEENQENIADEEHDRGEDGDDDEEDELDGPLDMLGDDPMDDAFVLHPDMVTGNATRRMQELFAREIDMNHGIIDMRGVGSLLRNPLDNSDPPIYIRNLTGNTPNTDMSHPFLVNPQNNTPQNPRRSNNRAHGLLNDINHSDEGSMISTNLMDQIFARTGFLDSIQHHHLHSHANTATNAEPQKNEPEVLASPLKEQVQHIHSFLLLFTDERWKQEAKVLYGTLANSKATRISTALLERLIPPAMEKIRILEEEKKRIELENKKKEEEEKAQKEKELREQQIESEGEHSQAENNEDVEMESTASAPPTEERVFVTIDGNDIDITGTGIDPTFLEALPDDLRQEVINQHMRELGSQRTSNAPESTEINPEFLNALPYAIRQEVLRQERMENQQRDSSPVGATTSTPLRSNIPVPSAGQNSSTATPKTKHVHSKESAQLLDLPGLASLLRLIFVPEPLGNDYLDRLLCNLCENTKTRTELLGLLFSVLVHGSNDLASVDKEFAQLTLKSRSNLPYAAKEKKINSLSDHDISDKIPNLVAQRCLESLTKLVTSSPAVGKYFLTEIENPLSSKTPKSTKKSKGKEKLYHPLNCYPVVLLLNLLEKSSFLQNGVVLEQLMQLLSNVLRPLAHLAKKKFSEPEEKDSMKTPTKDRKEKPDVKLPKIPDNSVRNVVNVLKGAVCSSRTFQHTLAVIQQLCTFPENMKIITKAILESAQSLGNIVVDDLDLLVEKLKVAPTTPGTNVDKAALEPFISATASQAKLLRILKSVDFMFSKNQDKAGSNGKSSDMETLKSHYEELKFTKLWTELGECMDIIENNENLIHVATIILPLIESFMVISTPSVSLSKEKPLTNTVSLPNVLLKQHSEISEIEQDSFFTFAEAHKKILNTMVRNNPSLMNGSFSLLVQNPKVLQFDNKRTYFTQQLHKNSIARVSHGSIQINVRRQYVFEESYQQLQGKSGDAIKYGKLNVRFRDEEGVDAGGVTREWFSALALQMFNPDYALFRPSAADKVTYQPNRTSGINPDHLFYFKFVGRIIGKAIYDGRLLDAYFTRSFYKCIINSPVDHRDMEAIDPEFYKSLDWMLNNDITDVLDLTFSLEVDDFGKQKIIDLKENGRNIPVTEANKTEYVRLVTEQKLVLAIKDQIQAFLNGFHEIIPRDLIKIFNEQELELLISGLPDIDIDDWKNNTEYQNYTSTSPQIQWFWRAVRSFSQEERAKLIQFATGTSKVPLGGFAQLQGSTGIQKFQIHREFSSNTRLPSAHTCFNQIDLPQYDNYEQLRAALLMAISECGTGKNYMAKFQGLGLHNVFNKRYEIISRFLMDINGVDFVADAHDAAVLRIVDMLRHPDDLTSKLPTLRKKIAMERASVEAQLKTVMETQLDSTQKGIDNLERCREETNTIKAALQNMDEICGDSENHIRNYSFIQKISRAHQNFTTTKTLVEKFQKINSQMNRVSKLLDDDSKRIIGHAENLLLIHYNIQQLSIFRSKILSEARGLSSDVLNTLNAMFKKLDQLEYKFEAYFWELAKNSIELVKADFPSTVVRIIKIIEVEEKLDEAISMQDFSEDMTGDAYDQLRGRQIKGYRIKYFDLLRDKINEEMKKTYLENQKELSAVLKSFDSIIDTLMFVHDDIAPLYPARYNIFHFFVLEYHRAIYNMVNTMTEGEIEPAVILILIKWVRDYYSSMALRLDVSEDLLEPRLLDGREDEFMESYVKLVRGKLSEWLKNILKTETVDFLERKNPPEMDTTEQYLFTGSVIVFQMFNQQLDVVAGTSRGQLLSEIVTECCCIMEEFQAAWIKIIDLEYNKFTHKQADLNEGLVEYIMALANDCMRSTEFSDTISARLETMSDEQYKAQNLSNVKIILDGFMKIQKRCLQILVEIVMSDLTPALNVLHCSQWYEQDIMKLIVGTFEDYGDDFQKHMSEYLNNKLTTELVDRFLIAYVESFKNKNAKFKMPSATDRMRQDLDSLITFFSRSKNAKRVKASFEVIEKIIGLIESNPRMLYIDFYSLWKQFPDMPLDFVEKVLSKRDDLDKSQVREIMELCRSKTKDERTEDVPPTIFSKISK